MTASDTGGQEEKPRRKGWLSYAVRLLVSVSVLALLIRSTSWSEISGVLSEADRRLIALGCLISVPIVVLKGVKWWLLLRHAGIGVPVRRTALSYMAGLGFGLITPGRVGELARIWVLGIDGQQYVMAGTLVVVDRVTDLAALLCLLSLTVMRFFGFGCFVVYVLAGAIAYALWVLIVERLRARMSQREGAGGAMHRIVEAMAGVRAVNLAIYLLFGLVVTLCGVLMVCVFLNALRPVRFVDCLVALPPVFMNSLLPVTVGGVGVRELLMTFVCNRIGIPGAVAISAILIYFTASLLIPGVAGLLLFASLPATKRRPSRPDAGA